MHFKRELYTHKIPSHVETVFDSLVSFHLNSVLVVPSGLHWEKDNERDRQTDGRTDRRPQTEMPNCLFVVSLVRVRAFMCLHPFVCLPSFPSLSCTLNLFARLPVCLTLCPVSHPVKSALVCVCVCVCVRLWQTIAQRKATLLDYVPNKAFRLCAPAYRRHICSPPTAHGIQW